MSRSASSRSVSRSVSSRSRSSGRSPIRSTSCPPWGRTRGWLAATVMARPRGQGRTASRARARRCDAAARRSRARGRPAAAARRDRDAREVLDLTGERPLIEALRVAPRALVDGGANEHLDEGPELLDQGPAAAGEPRRRGRWRTPPRRPCRVSRAASQPMRSTFASRSRFEKPSPFVRCSRTMSPSRCSTSAPRRSSSAPTRPAIVVLPAPESPVSQSVKPFLASAAVVGDGARGAKRGANSGHVFVNARK